MRDLDPACFAFVMATGIVSTGAYLLGPGWLSDALLIVAVAGLAVLTVALVWRLFMFRSSVAADLRAPDRVFGFFTITAGLNVLGVRFAVAGHPLVAAVLAVPAAIAWLLLTYGVPAEPAARQAAGLGPRRRRRLVAAVGGEHAVAVGRGGDPG